MHTPRLVLLNGPPGIGKSTLSRRYVTSHPGTLDLDSDRLCTFVGGWRERFSETTHLVRPLALGMVTTYLRGGQDVVMPQFLGRLGEVEKFRRAAYDGGGEFRHVVLLDDADRSVARFGRRGSPRSDGPPDSAVDRAAEEWHTHVRGYVAATGGDDALRQMHQRLLEVLDASPDAVTVDSVEDDEDATYRRLLAVLDP